MYYNHIMKKIIFTTEKTGFADIKFTQPQPSKNFIPSWFTNMPMNLPLPNNHNFVSKLIPNFKGARHCPSFVEVFREGYVLVAPCDIHMFFQDGEFFMNPSNDEFVIRTHAPEQFMDYIPEDTGIRATVNINTGWFGITPKGYGLRYLPLMYNFNKEWSANYGVVHTDKLHELSVQIFYTSDKNEILIKQGEPLCYIIPYKRESFNWTITPVTKKLMQKIRTGHYKVVNKFKTGYSRNES